MQIIKMQKTQVETSTQSRKMRLCNKHAPTFFSFSIFIFLFLVCTSHLDAFVEKAVPRAEHGLEGQGRREQAQEPRVRGVFKHARVDHPEALQVLPELRELPLHAVQEHPRLGSAAVQVLRWWWYSGPHVAPQKEHVAESKHRSRPHTSVRAQEHTHAAPSVQEHALYISWSSPVAA